MRNLEELRRRVPGAVIAETGLAAVARARGDLRAALGHRRAALALRPGDARLAAAVEAAAAALRRADSAGSQAAAAAAPADQAERAGIETLDRGEPAAALGHFLEVLRLAPGRRRVLQPVAEALRRLERRREETFVRLHAAGFAEQAAAVLARVPEADATLAALVRRVAVTPAQPFLVGLGHPRCGTSFTAHLLSRNGLAVGHERVRANGIVSWMLVVERLANPWGHAIGPLAPHRCFVVARSPLAAIPSIMGEDLEPLSQGWRAEAIRQRTGVDIRDPAQVPQTPAGRAVASYAHWYAMVLARPAAAIFRVDRPGDDVALGAFAGRPVRRTADIPTNARPTRYERVSWAPEMLATLPAPLAATLLDVTRRLGYPEDAERIAALTGGR
ncbi:hypothetical protein [Roseomonas sp. HF4]|uniref:hypothetical protein n=1 Tax=Roseomonas sp. HF4 TaxID=2562313 RepID=UPI0010C07698|nr:hypothetical protein [Roseomonas sp. HF4]